MGMATKKVTFTLDAETVRQIDDAAKRLAKSKSQIVREAVSDYHARIGRMGSRTAEDVKDCSMRWSRESPARPQKEVDAELRQARRARQFGGRLTKPGRR